eukprot:4814836-Pyramimonas_sp.AAC.1
MARRCRWVTVEQFPLAVRASFDGPISLRFLTWGAGFVFHAFIERDVAGARRPVALSHRRGGNGDVPVLRVDACLLYTSPSPRDRSLS